MLAAYDCVLMNDDYVLSRLLRVFRFSEPRLFILDIPLLVYSLIYSYAHSIKKFAARPGLSSKAIIDLHLHFAGRVSRDDDGVRLHASQPDESHDDLLQMRTPSVPIE